MVNNLRNRSGGRQNWRSQAKEKMYPLPVGAKSFTPRTVDNEIEKLVFPVRGSLIFGVNVNTKPAQITKILGLISLCPNWKGNLGAAGELSSSFTLLLVSRTKGSSTRKPPKRTFSYIGEAYLRPPIFGTPLE